MVDQPFQDRDQAPRRVGSAETWGYLLEALLEAGVPALIVLVTLLYAPYFSDYMIPKTAAIHAMVALLLGIWLSKAGLQGRLQLEGSPLYLPLLVYLGISLATLIWAPNRPQGGEVFLTQAWLLLFCLLVADQFRDSTAVSRVVWTVVVVSLLVSLLGILQYLGVHLIPLPKAYGDLPVSTLGNTNFVAHYLEITVLLMVGMLMVYRQRWERVLLGAGLAAAGCHLVLSRNRAGWLGTGVGLLVLFLLHRRAAEKRIEWKSAVVLVAVLVALLSPAVELVLDNVQVGEGESLYGRLEEIADQTVDRALSSFEMGEFTIAQRRIIWMDTLALLGDYFWTGVGTGNYEHLLPAYRDLVRHQQWKEVMGERREVAYQAHNEYLEVFAENGVFGLLAFLWVLGSLLWVGSRSLSSQTDRFTRGMTSACLGAMAATLVHCLFSFNLQDPTAATHFWLLGGLLLAVGRIGRGTGLGERVYRLDLSLGRLGRSLVWMVVALICGGGSYLGLCILMGDYYYFRGLQENEVGRPQPAIPAFQEAIDWRDWDFRYYHMLGMMQLKVGDYTAAEQSLTRSLEWHPNNAPALRLLGRARYWQGKGAEAVAALQQALQLEPLEFDAYQWLALAYRQQRAHDKAIETWKQALAFDPEDPSLLNSLGVEYAQAGQLEEAARVLQQAARLYPRDGQIQGNLGSIYLAMGQAGPAEPLLLQAVEQVPDKVEWRLALAQLYAGQKRLDLAQEQVEVVLGKEADNPVAQQLVQRLRQLRER